MGDLIQEQLNQTAQIQAQRQKQLSLDKQERQKRKEQFRLLLDRGKAWHIVILNAIVFIPFGIVVSHFLPQDILCPLNDSFCLQVHQRDNFVAKGKLME